MSPGVKRDGAAAPRRWWRSHQWQRAPVVLFGHASAFAALAIAGALVVLASSSGPFVTTADASSALKDKLSALSPLATGLAISGETGGTATTGVLLRQDDRRRNTVAALARRLELEPPIFTLESPQMVVNSARGSADVTLMARSDALAHVTKLSSVPGPGVWVADLTAFTLGLKPGDTLHVAYGAGGTSTTLPLRIKGLYRGLDRSPPSPYWANFLPEIFLEGADPPPPARYVFLSRAQIFAAAREFRGKSTLHFNGSFYQPGPGFAIATKAELAVDPHGLTLSHARQLERKFAAVRTAVADSTLGPQLGCVRPPRGVAVAPTDGPSPICQVASSLSSAVALADTSAASISPAISLLSDAGSAIALAVAAAAGFFLVRRRRGEAALLFARGESVAAFAARTGIEILLPTLLGGAAGFGIALGLTGTFAPSGSIDSGTVSSALAHGGIALAAALALAVAVTCAVFARQFDAGRRRRGLRVIPWELPLLGVAIWLLVDVRTGGGLTTNAKTGASHPTLAVFVFPLLLAAGVAGLLARGARLLLRRSAAGAGRAPTPVFLLARRLAAARGTLVVLAVVSAAAFGAYYYASAVATSLTRGVAEKAYVAYGGDVQGVVSDSSEVPRSFPYPATRVDYANQVATLGSASGAYADILDVDASSLASVIHWYSAWGRNPRSALARLGRPISGTLPVLTVGPTPARLSAIWDEGIRIPVTPVGTDKSFPGMVAGTPLLVVDRKAFAAVAKARHAFEPLGTPQTLIWANGPPAAVSRALQADPLQATFVTTVDDFRKDPDVTLAKRTFAYMRLIAIAAGILVLIALVLYLQARQRTQAIASALASRMGLSRRAEVASLALELGSIALFAAVVGGVVAISSAAPIVGHIDPLSTDPPAPSLVIPLSAILASAAALVVLAVAAGVLVSSAARRTNMSEALRVA
jgi:putative ABC transport system permease protein